MAHTISSLPEENGAIIPRDLYGTWRAWYALIVFEIQLLASGIDIAIVTLLVRPIENALHLNDVSFATITTVSLMIGFSLQYPAGLLADTFRRRDVIAAGSAIWALAAVVAARADSGAMLFVARLLAGIGVGATVPAMFSVITDAFPRTRRAFAISLYMGGYSIGLGVGLTICGVLVQAAQRNGMVHLGGMLISSWQQCFVGVAAIGIVALALVLSVPEPPRLERSMRANANLKSTFGVLGRYLRGNWILWTLLLVGNAVGFTSYSAIGTWGPAFGMRHYGITGVSSIALLGAFSAGGSLLGCIVGGILAHRGLNHDNPRILPRIIVVVAAISCVFAGFFPYMPSWLLAVVGIGALDATAMALQVLITVGIQETAPNEVRGQLYGLWNFISVIPMAGAPTLVAVLASGIFAKTGGLGPAMAVAGGVTSVLSVLLFAFSGAPYERATREKRSFMLDYKTP